MLYAMEIELTSHCQLSCPFCRTGKSLKHKYPQVPRGMMEKETLLNILNKIPLPGHALLYNWGEPFLHPDLLWFVQQTKSRINRCDLSTNMQIFSEEIAEGLINSKVNYLRVSCDGLSQESYEKYRMGGSLEKVTRHTKMLSDMKKKMNSNLPVIILQMAVSRHNEQELPLIPEFASRYGFNEISLINLCAMTPEGYVLQPLYEAINPAWKKYWSIGNVTNCRQPWEHITLDWNGDVYTCCNPSGVVPYKMGNINESSFEDIWNGKKYQYVREFCSSGVAVDNGFEIMCHACYNKFPSELSRTNDMYSPCLKIN